MPQCGALVLEPGLGWIVLGAGGMPVATDPAGAPSTGSANNGSRTHKCEHCTDPELHAAVTGMPVALVDKLRDA